MQESSLQLQVKSIIDESGCSQQMVAILNTAGVMFQSFLEEHDLPPGRLENVSPRAMARFVKHCRTLNMDVDALVMTLTALYILLMRAGFQAGTLAALAAPTHRVRGKNDTSGKYSYQSRFLKPASGPSASPDPFDEA